MKTLNRLFKAQDGATMIEYALIAALIAIAAISAMGTLGDTISAKFNTVGKELKNAGKQ